MEAPKRSRDYTQLCPQYHGDRVVRRGRGGSLARERQAPVAGSSITAPPCPAADRALQTGRG